MSDDKRQQMQALIDDCDFVGMSFYAPVTVSPTPDDFVRGIDRFMGEFKQHGLSVPTDKPMQFSEVGIGGGRLRSDEEPNLTKAVAAPWEGTAFPRNNPWRDESMRSLRRQYHAALLQFLAQQPARGAFRLRSSGAWVRGIRSACGNPNSPIRKSLPRLKNTTGQCRTDSEPPSIG